VAHNREVETEIKLALPDEAVYRKLRDLLGRPLRATQQENRFLDGPDGDLRFRKAVLRLRRELEILPDAASPGVPAGERVYLTLKTEGRVSGAVHTRGEIEAEVTPCSGAFRPDPGWLMTLDLEPVRVVRQMLPGLKRLVDQGGFSNYREVFAAPAGSRRLSDSLWELDRTEFPGGMVHYELEVELARSAPGKPGALQGTECGLMESRAELELYGVLQSWSIPVVAQPASKYERWLGYRSAH